MVSSLQNFYEATITRNWSATTGNLNVSVAPTISSGYIVISPSDRVRREIIKFSATGTNSYGPFITVSNISDRGLGGTTAQTHTIGEKVRMNITAQHWDELIASAVAPTVDVGTTTTLVPGSNATVTNSGTTIDAVLDFGIPAGSTIYSATSIPDNSVGRNGDWAFDTSVNSYVWYKSGGAWALVNSLKGATGDGNGIASIVKTATVGLVDTYTITYDDSTTTTFDVTNGAKGDTGDDGLSLVPKGAYNALTEYVANDIVSYLGSSWIALQTTTGNIPEEGVYWTLNAAKGTDGTGTGDMLKSTYDTTNKNTDIFTYADGKVEDSIVDGHTTVAPSGNAVFDALAGKQDTMTKATQAEVATGTDDTKYTTPLAVAPYANNSLYRQAIINGNFDVWQRGTSFLQPAGIYIVDRFKVDNTVDQNVKFIQSTTVPNTSSKYSLRGEVYSATGGTNSFSDVVQLIENYSYFEGKTVTASVYAKCDTGVTGLLYIADNTGISSTVNINSTSWTKYTITYTVPTGITYLGVKLRFNRGGITVGTGINFAQVQLNAGNVALPFMPKSFADELRDCQRYYEKSYPYAVVPGTTASDGYNVSYALGTTPNNARYNSVRYIVTKRVNSFPTIYPYTTPSNTSRVSDTSGVDLAAGSGTVQNASNIGFNVSNVSGGNITTGGAVIFHWTVDAEL